MKKLFNIIVTLFFPDKIIINRKVKCYTYFSSMTNFATMEIKERYFCVYFFKTIYLRNIETLPFKNLKAINVYRNKLF